MTTDQGSNGVLKVMAAGLLGHRDSPQPVSHGGHGAHRGGRDHAKARRR
jgi:hypothetical protein